MSLVTLDPPMEEGVVNAALRLLDVLGQMSAQERAAVAAEWCRWVALYDEPFANGTTP